MKKGAAVCNTPRRESVVLCSVFALLVSNSAAGLASGLAGCLAFAAAAVLLACAEIAGLDGLDVFHIMNLQLID